MDDRQCEQCQHDNPWPRDCDEGLKCKYTARECPKFEKKVLMEKETVVTCYDCKRPYSDGTWPGDMLIQDSLWLDISPTGHEGGILCPSCIVKALLEKTGRTAAVVIVMDEDEVYRTRDLDELHNKLKCRKRA